MSNGVNDLWNVPGARASGSLGAGSLDVFVSGNLNDGTGIRALCAEQFMSGIGFADIFNKKNNTNFNSHEIVELDKKGDPRANLEFNLYEDRMARLMAVMIGIFDPDVIILGGGMSNIDRLYKNIPMLIGKYIFSNQVKTKILQNFHGDSSGVRGAAWLWNED